MILFVRISTPAAPSTRTALASPASPFVHVGAAVALTSLFAHLGAVVATAAMEAPATPTALAAVFELLAATAAMSTLDAPQSKLRVSRHVNYMPSGGTLIKFAT